MVGLRRCAYRGKCIQRVANRIEMVGLGGRDFCGEVLGKGQKVEILEISIGKCRK